MSSERSGRRVRLSDVATLAGVSTGTVSLVLNRAPGPSAATRERVLQAAEASGYRPDRAASSLARRRSRLLGVTIDVSSTYHAALVEELDVAAEAAGYELVFSTTTRHRRSARAIETLLDSRCEALVLLGPDAPTAQLNALGAEQPLVVVGRRMVSKTVDLVRSADDLGVAAAVAHLAALGHRRLAYIGGGSGTIATDRRAGFRLGVRSHGLQGTELLGDGDETGGRSAADALIARRGEATGVVCFNDRTATGLLAGLLTYGVDVPGEVSVVGYDDSPSARLPHVNLTSVDQDAVGQARCAITALVERLDEGRTEPTERVLQPKLVVRGTTSKPRPTRARHHPPSRQE